MNIPNECGLPSPPHRVPEAGEAVPEAVAPVRTVSA